MSSMFLSGYFVSVRIESAVAVFCRVLATYVDSRDMTYALHPEGSGRKFGV
jgi:hypothetical protein